MKATEPIKARKLWFIKMLHTVIWCGYMAVLFYLLYAVIFGRIDKWVWICIGLVLLEVLILLIFKLVCPLTLIARRYSDSKKSNFDIFLPNWLAKYNKLIYGCIFGIAVVILVFRMVGNS